MILYFFFFFPIICSFILSVELSICYNHNIYSVLVTSRYIHCLCTVKTISMTSRIRERVLSHLSTWKEQCIPFSVVYYKNIINNYTAKFKLDISLHTSASNALTYLEAFIVESVTWLSSRSWNTSSVALIYKD